MKKENRYWFFRGMRDAIPIGLGYFAVALTLGIAAAKAGMTAGQASITSLLLNASAGEFIGFTLIAQNAGYFEVLVMEAVANARYLLMSCALSQKLDNSISIPKRLLLGFNVTDEIFGICVGVKGKLNPFYAYGADVVAMPGWALGTLCGALLGAILPTRVMSALSVSLYGMFVAIFIPPAKENKIVLATVIIGMILSFVMAVVPLFDFIPEGMRIILLTVIISLGAAIMYPVKEADENAA